VPRSRTDYPLVKSYGRFPQALSQQLADIVAGKQPTFAALRNAKNVQSRDVLSILRDGLEKLGFDTYRLFRVTEGKSFQLDAFSEKLGVALEVEKGRVILGNQLYLDLFKFHVIPQVKHAAIILPSVSREETEQPFATACDVCDVVYSSPDRRLGFHGLLLIGY
jgi:hypothetical protein